MPGSHPSFGTRLNKFVPLPDLGIRTELILTLIVMAVLILVQTARAEIDIDIDSPKKKNTKRTTVNQTITTTVTEDDGNDDTMIADTPASTEEGVITTKFGSKASSGTADCKTTQLADDVVRKLKIDCGKWLKERKSELKVRYRAGTCEDSCEDCGMSLRRCTVTGSVTYAK